MSEVSLASIERGQRRAAGRRSWGLTSTGWFPIAAEKIIPRGPP